MRLSQQAYTLMEALVGLALIAILTAISIPSLRSVIDQHNDAILQSTVMRAIRLARQETYIRGKSISICKSKNHLTCGGEWSDGLLVFIDEEENGLVLDKQQIISIVQINTHQGKISWRAYPYYRHHLHFTPSRILSADNGTFWYCRVKSTLPVFAIAVSKTGGARVIYPDNNGEIRDSLGRVLHC